MTSTTIVATTFAEEAYRRWRLHPERHEAFRRQRQISCAPRLRNAWTALRAYAMRIFLRRFEYEVTVVDVEHDMIIAQLLKYSIDYNPVGLVRFVVKLRVWRYGFMS